MKLRGTITAIVTPFQTNSKVDIPTLKKLVDFQIEAGIDGIVVCGSTGEAATLTFFEQELAIRTVVKQVKGKAPVIAGAGSNNTEEAVELSRLAKKAGSDALLHITPYYNKPTPNGLLAHFKAIANATDLPIILYNVPGRTGSNVLPETIINIAHKVPQVVGVKEASGNINQMMDIIKGKSKDFAVLSGDDSLTFPLIAVGGVGIISVVANEIPKEFSEMVHAALDGNFNHARALHYEWLDLMNANFIESNPIPVKTALAEMGLIHEAFRLPLTPMTSTNKEKLVGVLKKHKLI